MFSWTCNPGWNSGLQSPSFPSPTPSRPLVPQQPKSSPYPWNSEMTPELSAPAGLERGEQHLHVLAILVLRTPPGIPDFRSFGTNSSRSSSYASPFCLHIAIGQLSLPLFLLGCPWTSNSEPYTLRTPHFRDSMPWNSVSWNSMFWNSAFFQTPRFLKKNLVFFQSSPPILALIPTPSFSSLPSIPPTPTMPCASPAYPGLPPTWPVSPF